MVLKSGVIATFALMKAKRILLLALVALTATWGCQEKDPVDNVDKTGSEEGGVLAHTMANDAGDSDRRGQDGQQLLERENDELTELGLVIYLVDQIHRDDLLLIYRRVL